MKSRKKERQKRKEKKREQSATLKSWGISFCLCRKDFNHEGEKRKKWLEIREKSDWLFGIFFKKVLVCYLKKVKYSDVDDSGAK